MQKRKRTRRILVGCLRKKSRPRVARIIKEKSVRQIKRDGWAVAQNGIFRRKGILANGVGRANIRVNMVKEVKKRVFLSRRKNTAKTARIKGITPM